MKLKFSIFFLCLTTLLSCEKDIDYFSSRRCINTGFTGPVKYYLSKEDRDFYESYKNFKTLTFVDSFTRIKTEISCDTAYYTNDFQRHPTYIEGDTLDIGEHAYIYFTKGNPEIGRIEYDFNAYENGLDSIRISIIGSNNSSNYYPKHPFYWALNLADIDMINVRSNTPFIVLDSIRLFAKTFRHVYILQGGNSLYLNEPANICYYTKEHGIIAFTDKRMNRFWIRTNY